MAYKKPVNPVALLNEQLRTDSLQKAYLLYGEEEFLKKEYTDKIISKTLGNEDDGLSLTKLDADSYSVEKFTDGLETVSFFGGKKVVILRNLLPEQLKNDGEILRSLLGEIDDSVRVIFYFDALYLVNKDFDKVRERSRLLESFSDCCTVLNFEHQAAAILTRWAESFFTKNRVSITSRAVSHLVDLCNCDMGKLRGEAVKVASLQKEEITEADVDQVVSPSIEVNVFALSKDIMELCPKHMLKTLQEARQTKESPTKLLYNLASAFCEMTYVKLGVSANKTLETVMADFKLPKKKQNFLQGYYSLCRDISVVFFIDALKEITACDMAFKGGDGESWERLELLCLNLLSLRRKQEKR